MKSHPILDELAGAGMRLGLGRMRDFLAAQGNPESQYPVLHVGGTNGKGSVCRMLGNILQCNGLSVGVHTSPHLQEVNERILVNGRMIDNDAFTALVEQLDLARRAWAAEALPLDAFPLTYFEFTVAAAYKHFAEMEVQVAVIEVGMGGRLDATNVCSPVATAIVSVGLDHCDELGSDVASIAGEKAGIIKPGVPVVTGPMPAEALQVIRSVAAERGAPLSVWGVDFEGYGESGSFRYRGQREIGGLVCGLSGDHQVVNAAVALRALEVAGIAVKDDALRAGLAGVRHPGRLEWLASDLLVDGAHNADGANALAAYLATLSWDRRRVLLLGGGRDKDIRSVAAALASQVDRIYTTACDHPKARTPWEVATELEGLPIPVSPAGPLAEAVPACRDNNTLVIAAGSLYMVGAVRDLVGAVPG